MRTVIITCPSPTFPAHALSWNSMSVINLINTFRLLLRGLKRGVKIHSNLNTSLANSTTRFCCIAYILAFALRCSAPTGMHPSFSQPDGAARYHGRNRFMMTAPPRPTTTCSPVTTLAVNNIYSWIQFILIVGWLKFTSPFSTTCTRVFTRVLCDKDGGRGHSGVSETVLHLNRLFWGRVR